MSKPDIVQNEDGTTIIEFAAVLPLMCIALLGGMDLCHREYAQSILTGSVQKIGRDTTLQGGADNIAINDAKVRASVLQIAPDAVFNFSRTFLTRYRDVEGEPFTDTNGDGIRQAGECYDDVNGNSQWDANVSSNGNGGADDVVLYKVTVTYPRLFPIANFLGWDPNQTISADTALKNQPYATQNQPTVVARCA
ncbi:TadE-like domain-containing protein [Sphingomonas antarctica]|uniref:TadE/TadG family type IV pilus assembly protein n=1 Tax=Sphingomonas antarctica TaxID=2040274 RepID=UPI0039EB5DDE